MNSPHSGDCQSLNCERTDWPHEGHWFIKEDRTSYERCRFCAWPIRQENSECPARRPAGICEAATSGSFTVPQKDGEA